MQVAASGITVGSTVGTSVKLFGFAALWYYLFPGTLGPWTAYHEDAAVVRNWVRLRYDPAAPSTLTALPQLDPSTDRAVAVPQFLFELIPAVLPILLAIATSAVAARVLLGDCFGRRPQPAAATAAAGATARPAGGLGGAVGTVLDAVDTANATATAGSASPTSGGAKRRNKSSGSS